MDHNRLLELSSAIKAESESLDGRIRQLETAQLSFDNGIEDNLLRDQRASALRQSIADSCYELQALVQGPYTSIFYPRGIMSASIQVIAKYQMAEKVSEANGATFAEIAHSTDLDVETVKRILRHACSLFMSKEEPIGVIRHNAMSRALSQNRMLNDWICMATEEILPSTVKLSEALSSYPKSQEPNACGFSLANSTDLPIFKYLPLHEDHTVRFGNAMTCFSQAPDFSIVHLTENHPFETYENGSFVDIGGSHGTAGVAIAKKNPTMKCVIQDLPIVIEAGRKGLTECQDQITFMEHDFFAEQPIKAANVYLLRQILHDWSDKYATKILKAIVPAMNEESTIIIMENFLPEPGLVSKHKEMQSRSMDLAMYSIANGRERAFEDWENLLSIVDPRLVISKMIRPQKSALGLLEL